MDSEKHTDNQRKPKNVNWDIECDSKSMIECLDGPLEVVEEQRESKRNSNSDYNIYCVQEGDTIERVAAKFKMTPNNLVAVNKLHARTLFVNQRLKVTKSVENEIDNLTELTNGEKETTKKKRKEQLDNANCDKVLMPLHYEEDHLKVVSKYITDSEGIIKGKLLLTSAFFTFIPAFSDPVIMENGEENFTIHLPNSKIACVSMYNDAEMMAYKRTQRKDIISKIVVPKSEVEWASMNNDAALHDLSTHDGAVGKKKFIDGSLSHSLSDFLNRSEYVHDIESLKNLKFIDHKYLCVVASPRYRKIKAGYQKEDEYWFMIPTDRAQALMDYFLTHSQSKYDIGADVDPNSNWGSETGIVDSYKGRMVKRNSFAKVDDIHGPLAMMKNKLEGALKKLRSKSIQWEIVNTDIEFPLDISFDESEEVNSKILDSVQVKELMKHLPAETVDATWELIYTTERDGWSLSTLYRNVYNSTRGCCLLLIKDFNSNILGAMCNTYIRMSSSCYGNGTTFIFHWNPNFEKFSYSKKNHYFLYGQPDFFSIGFSNGNNAIRIEKSLFEGCTQSCDTFDSPPLVASGRFDIINLEVWSFY